MSTSGRSKGASHNEKHEGPRVSAPNLLQKLNFRWGSPMPVTLQTEAAECGLACLVMLLAHHGVVTDLPTLRSRYGTVPQGMTAIEFTRVASAERLMTRTLRLELDEMKALQLPCVLHWDMGHFVVYRGMRGDRYLITDPAFGERQLTAREMAESFTGIAMECWPDEGFMPRKEAQAISLRRLAGRVTGLWPTVWRVLSVSMGLEVLALLSPLFLQWVVDHVLMSHDRDLLTTLGVGFVLLLAIELLLSLMRSMLLLRVSTQLRVQWRSNVLNHLMSLPLDYFARRHLGDIVSRFGSINKIQSVLTAAFVEAALDGVMVLLGLALMTLYSPLLTVIAVTAVALYALIRMVWYRPLRDATAEQIVRSANESSHLLETVRGMRTIRLFSRHAERLAAWQTLMVSDVNAKLRIERLSIVYRQLRHALAGGFALMLLWVGAREVMAGALTVGALLAFMAFRSQFESRITRLIDTWFSLRMAGLDAQRLADIVLTPAEPGAGNAASPLRSVGVAGRSQPPSIEVRNVSFRYAEGSPDVLKNFSLSVAAGESIAIAGASGCGKSTLVSLLLGVYKPSSGTIEVDGKPIEHWGMHAWRSTVGTVLQDDVLFSGSIADNIAFFDPKMSMKTVMECARLAAIHDDIESLPMGYQSLIGDMGSTLSGGQKQRVLLARAMYRKPRVLILDEATSHLDLDCEAAVGRAVASLPVTRILVAHRPHTLATVHRVVELADGRIVRDETRAQYAARMGLALFKPYMAA